MGASLESMPAPWANGNGTPTLYVFGYGSLLWKTGFAYEKQYRALLRGYSRRFYQGNTTFRGTPALPGRVVTLMEDEGSQTYGLAFKVEGWPSIFDALEHLYMREIENGYSFRVVTLEFLDTGEVGHALTCIALKHNIFFLGPPVDPASEICPSDFESRDQNQDQDQDQDRLQRSMALDIVRARGKAGSNSEYILKLACSMRELFPNVEDEDLFQLEAFVISFLDELKQS